MSKLVAVDAVLFRYITRNDYKSLNGLHATDTAGGARHIELGKNQFVHSFFKLNDEIEQECGSFEDDEVFEVLRKECKSSGRKSINFTITIEPVGAEIQKTEFALRYQKVRDAWQIGNLNEERYSLWDEKYGFTKLATFENAKDPSEHEYYNETSPTIIYFVRDDGNRYHSRALYKAIPEHIDRFPEPLSSTWHKLTRRNINQIKSGRTNTGMIGVDNGN